MTERINPVTVCYVSNRRPSEPYYLYDWFFVSLHRFGYDPVRAEGKYNGLGSKPRLLLKLLESGLVPTTDIIFTDCWDVVFAKSPTKIHALWRELWPDAPIVWNAEKNCFPDATLASEHPANDSPFRYLNSGFAIGPVDKFIAALRIMDAYNLPGDHMQGERRVEPNDQDYWMRQFLLGPVPLKLDVDSRLCLAMCGITSKEFAERKDACAFHLNGPAKTAGFRDAVLKEAGLLP